MKAPTPYSYACVLIRVALIRTDSWGSRLARAAENATTNGAHRSESTCRCGFKTGDARLLSSKWQWQWKWKSPSHGSRGCQMGDWELRHDENYSQTGLAAYPQVHQLSCQSAPGLCVVHSPLHIWGSTRQGLGLNKSCVTLQGDPESRIQERAGKPCLSPDSRPGTNICRVPTPSCVHSCECHASWALRPAGRGKHPLESSSASPAGSAFPGKP